MGCNGWIIRSGPQWDWKTSAYKDNAFNSDQVNEFGYRGQPIKYDDGDYIVLLLGDSFIEAGVQPQAVRPERILQFILREYGITNAKVFSIASAGWSVDQELIGLQAYFSRYRADAVIHCSLMRKGGAANAAANRAHSRRRCGNRCAGAKATVESGSHNEFGRAFHTVKESSDSGFGFVFAAVLAVLAARNLWREGAAWRWEGTVSVFFLALALLRPIAPIRLRRPIGSCDGCLKFVSK